MNGLIAFCVLVGLAALIWRFWPAVPARMFKAIERHRSGLKSCHVQSGDNIWHVLEGGRGEPLVMLHGFNADADHFCRVAQHLRHHFRILAPDLPGFGETGQLDTTALRIEDQASAVVACLDQLGIRHCYLGGSSMGGYIAAMIARSHPERVRGLWLLAPGGIRSVEPSPLFQEIEEERHNPLIVRDLDDFRRLVDYCFVHPPWIPSALARDLAAKAAARALDHQRMFDAVRYDSVALEDFAAEIAVPTLIVWGRSDQVLNPAGAEVLKQVMPSAELLMLEQPRTVAEAWLSFTENQARRQRSDLDAD